ncbi:MAG: hypothetical protein N2Z73_00505, partial [Endomicrobia bacterium]|nr:hypothetical protein [Endomicrobiia bacterium]
MKETAIKDELINSQDFTQELTLFKNYIVSVFMAKNDIRILVTKKVVRVRKQEMEFTLNTSKLPIIDSFQIKLLTKDGNGSISTYDGESDITIKHTEYPISYTMKGRDTYNIQYLVKGKYQIEIYGNNILGSVKKDIYAYNKNSQDIYVPYKGKAYVTINFLEPLKNDASLLIGNISYTMRKGEQIKNFEVDSGDVTVDITTYKSNFLNTYNLKHNKSKLILINEDADYSYMTENVNVLVCNQNENTVNFSLSRKQKLNNMQSGSDFSGMLYSGNCTHTNSLKKQDYILEWTDTKKGITMKEKVKIKEKNQTILIHLNNDRKNTVYFDIRAKKPDGTDVNIDNDLINIVTFNSSGYKESFNKTNKVELFNDEYTININAEGFVSKQLKINVCDSCKSNFIVYLPQTEQTRAVKFIQEIEKDDDIRITDVYIETYFYDKVNNKTEKTLVNIEGTLKTNTQNKIEYEAQLPTNKSFIASLVLKCEAYNTKFEHITTMKIKVLSELETKSKPEFNFTKAVVKGNSYPLIVKRRVNDTTIHEENSLRIKFEVPPTSNNKVKNGIRNLLAINPGTKVWLPDKAYIRASYSMDTAIDINKYMGGNLNEENNEAYAFTINSAVGLEKPDSWESYKEFVTPIKITNTKYKNPIIYIEYALNNNQKYYLGISLTDEHITNVDDKKLEILTDKITIKKVEGKYNTEMDILKLKQTSQA